MATLIPRKVGSMHRRPKGLRLSLAGRWRLRSISLTGRCSPPGSRIRRFRSIPHPFLVRLIPQGGPLNKEGVGGEENPPHPGGVQVEKCAVWVWACSTFPFP